MDDLTTRLLAAIDAKEATARAATPGPWMWVDPGPRVPRVYGDKVKSALVRDKPWHGDWVVIIPAAGGDSYPSTPDARHIEDNDPADVLRRCAADRKIVERHVKVVEMWDQGDERGLFDVEICGTCAYGTSCGHCFDRDDLPLVAWPCPTLLDLAEVYGITEENARA